MKQWLMILALVWAAATVNAAGEERSCVIPDNICTAVLSQAEEEHAETEEVPLLAMPCARGSQMLSTEQTPGKGGRQSEHTAAGHAHNHAAGHDLRLPATNLHGYEVHSPGIRTTDRYIYFLRRIII